MGLAQAPQFYNDDEYMAQNMLRMNFYVSAVEQYLFEQRQRRRAKAIELRKKAEAERCQSDESDQSESEEKEAIDHYPFLNPFHPEFETKV